MKTRYEVISRIISVLRAYSSKDAPLTVSQIAKLCGMPQDIKRISKCIEECMAIQDGEKWEMFDFHNRGYICDIGKKRGNAYYLDDLLTEEERGIIEGYFAAVTRKRRDNKVTANDAMLQFVTAN